MKDLDAVHRRYLRKQLKLYMMRTRAGRPQESFFAQWMNSLDNDARQRLLQWIESSHEMFEIVRPLQNLIDPGFQPTDKSEHFELNKLLKISLAVEQHTDSPDRPKQNPSRPPFNAEYILYLLLRKEEREVVIGDLIEGYGQVLRRFNKRRADLWFYKQVAGSVLPLLRRALLRLGALVWLGRILRRLIS